MTKSSSASIIYLLHVQFEEIRPAIWRDLLIPAATTLAKVHAAIQAAFPWSNFHLHQFDVHGEIISDPRCELDYAEPDERKVTLAQAATKVGEKFIYEYDLGDGWRHEVTVKEILPPAIGTGAPKMQCTGGARACPPDDCGGVGGYEELVIALARPNHERHRELTEWLTSYREELASFDLRFEGPYDPEASDLVAANKVVGKLTRRARA